jgi:hypothetical protein
VELRIGLSGDCIDLVMDSMAPLCTEAKASFFLCVSPIFGRRMHPLIGRNLLAFCQPDHVNRRRVPDTKGAL